MGVCVSRGCPRALGQSFVASILPLAHSRFKDEDMPGTDMSRQGLWEPLSQNFKAKKAVLTVGPTASHVSHPVPRWFPLPGKVKDLRKGTPLASRVAQGVSGPSSSCVCKTHARHAPNHSERCHSTRRSSTSPGDKVLSLPFTGLSGQGCSPKDR